VISSAVISHVTERSQAIVAFQITLIESTVTALRVNVGAVCTHAITAGHNPDI
jgi:hypothetical protein